jgi:hypothetical protein
MKIIKQILKEFWIPLLGSIIWTVINYYNSEKPVKDWTELVSIFAPAFFFLSWMTGHFFRVKKQTGVSENLKNILVDITEQSAKMKLITDTQVFQTFDKCLDSVREVKEELSDRNRLFKKEKTIELTQFELYKDNPFYQSKRLLNRLINYASYTIKLNQHEELKERYTRTSYHCEELAGVITNLIAKMNHERLKWQTPKTESLLKEISSLIKQLQLEIVPYSKYKDEHYKGINLNTILETHIEALNKNSE